MKRRKFRIPRRMLDLDDEADFGKDWTRFNEIDIQARWKDLQPRLNAPAPVEKPMIRAFRRYAAAAVITLLIGGVVLWTLSSRRETSIQTQPSAATTTRCLPWPTKDRAP
ncbi:hypothetical protein ACQ86N_01470 [Puia sp. P3]|uniref:hypothetical protein n=1 Tax=Puia sp. P3 TaxID=3423952 RepID=UPI003D66C062